MLEEYSPYKIVHHTEKLEAMRMGKQTPPLQVQVVPSNKCQHGCTFCAYRTEGFITNEDFRAKDELDYYKILQCLDNFVDMGVKAVHYTGGGEPLIHPQIQDIFKSTLHRGLDLALVTNGELLTVPVCEILGDAKWVRVSMDAVYPATFGQIRRVDGRRIDKIFNNIRCLVRHKKENIIGVGFVVNEYNYREVVEAASFYKGMGVDNFRISASFTPKGINYFKDFKEKASILCKEAETLSDKNFQVFNLFSHRLGDLFEGKQNYHYCAYKELSTYIGADYNVYTCCTLAYNKQGLIGSIKTQSFKELWESDWKNIYFGGLFPSSHCQLPCMYKGKNEFINYCIKKQPKHINFV